MAVPFTGKTTDYTVTISCGQARLYDYDGNNTDYRPLDYGPVLCCNGINPLIHALYY